MPVQKLKRRQIIGFFIAILVASFFLNSPLTYIAVFIGVLAICCPTDALGTLATFAFLLNQHNIALKLCNLGLKLDREDPCCLTTKSAALINQNQFQQAEDVAVLAVPSNLHEPIQNLWAALYSQGRSVEALKYANRLIEMKPKLWAGYYARALSCTHLALNKYHDQILEDEKKVLELAPNSDRSFCIQSVVNLNLSKIDESIENGHRAIKKNPKYDDYKILLANAYLHKYDLDKCTEILESVAKKKRIGIYSNHLRALIFLAQDMPQAALRDLESLKQENIKHPSIAYSSGIALNMMNELQAAYELGQFLTEEFRESSLGYILKGHIYQKSHEYEKSMEVYEEAISLNRFQASSFWGLGLAQYHLGMHEEAKTNCEKALSLNKYDHIAARVKSLCLAEMNQLEEAAKWMDYADEIYCNDGFSWYSNGILANAKNEPERALDQFSQAISLNPFESASYRERAKLHALMNHTKEADEDRKKEFAIEEKINAEKQKFA